MQCLQIDNLNLKAEPDWNQDINEDNPQAEIATYDTYTGGSNQQTQPMFPAAIKIEEVAVAANNSISTPMSDEEFVELPKRDLLRVTEDRKPCRCATCGLDFADGENYVGHVCNQSDTTCSVCGIKVCKRSYLEVHMRIHTGEKPFKCTKCPKAFGRKSLLTGHLKRHEFKPGTAVKRPFKCSLCPKNYTRKSHLRVHMKFHINGHPYKCAICPKTFPARARLVTHLRCHTPTEIQSKKDELMRANNKQMISKLESIPKVDIFIKQEDQECYDDSAELNRTDENTPKIETNIGSPPENFETTADSRVLEDTTEDILSDGPFNCSICHKRLYSKSRLEAHNCLDDKLYERHQCPICGKNYSQKDYLKVHMRIHSNEKPFSCWQCGKGFIRMGVLRQHLKRHESDSQYRCDLCPKLFLHKSTLTRHIMTHVRRIPQVEAAASSYMMGTAVERPFTCSLCPKSYTNESHLRVHMRLHIHGYPYKCAICPKSFPARARLVTHLRCHTETEIQSKKDELMRANNKQMICKLESIPMVDIYIKQEEQEFYDDSTELNRTDENTPKIETNIGRPPENFETRADSRVLEDTTEDVLNDGPFNCSICHKKLYSRSLLEAHNCLDDQFYARHQCPICGKNYSQKDYLKVHMRIHSNEKPFSCWQCGKGFIRMGILRQHLKRHGSDSQYRCDLCPKLFLHKSTLTRHIMTHVRRVENDGSKCMICDRTFADKSYLGAHMRLHTGLKMFACTICPRAFNRNSELKAHMDVHAHGKPYSCFICFKSFYHRLRLMAHLKTHDSLNEAITSNDPPVLEHFPAYVSINEEQSGHEAEDVESLECVDPLQKVEPILLDPLETISSSFQCPVCMKNFIYKGRLDAHNCQQNSESDSLCDICGKRLCDKFYLAVHRQRHFTEKPFKCQFCEKSYVRQYELNSHVKKLHGNGSAIKCEVCSREFFTSEKLAKHMKSHTGEKPFGCTICEKAFRTLIYLRKHMVCHSDKKFSCQVCFKTFFRVRTLVKHMNTHTRTGSTKTFNCDVCSKSFFSKCGLATHMKRHWDKTP